MQKVFKLCAVCRCTNFPLLVQHSHNFSVTNGVVLHDVRAVESTTNIYLTLAVKSFQKTEQWCLLEEPNTFKTSILDCEQLFLERVLFFKLIG